MLALIVDTNLFHEFRNFEDLPWEELGEPDEIILVVTEPVQTELDEHKKSPSARLKRRALKWTKEFRHLILADNTDIVVREAEPRVIVRLDCTRPDTNHDDVLDRSVPDDCIVAIALALLPHHSVAKMAVFSDDLRPLRKARQVSLTAIEIPVSWRRKPEQTEEDKARTQLERQVVQLRRQEPELVLSASVELPIEHVLPVYEALSDEHLDELIHAVRQHWPVETDFEKAKRPSILSQQLQTISLGVTRREFHPAPEEDIIRYVEEDYPGWLEKCREHLGQAHKLLGMPEYDISFIVELANQGTRPALDLQISFRVHGDVRILPNCGGEASRFVGSIALPFSLPKAPKAPQGEWKTYNPLDYLGGLHNRSFDHLAHSFPRTLEDVLRDQQRDPNRFYYRDKPHEPTSGYSLTCAQFRHADEVECFDILIQPSADVQALDGKNAVVEVTCNASNLTAPVTLKIPVRFRCEQHSTYDAVRESIVPKPFFGRTET
jgi:hypothetical protein